MRLFLDTEFTDLIPEYKLISIALVDEDENYFYAELLDTYKLSDCSEFVKANVLPLLRHGKYSMTEYQCKLALCKWIEDRSTSCNICTDAPSWDIPLLKPLLEPCIPNNLEQELTIIRISHEATTNLVAKFGYDIHNALDDAFVMKKATLGY
jgi:hypothetical protein